jgi:hypothetical protein
VFLVRKKRNQEQKHKNKRVQQIIAIIFRTKITVFSLLSTHFVCGGNKKKIFKKSDNNRGKISNKSWQSEKISQKNGINKFTRKIDEFGHIPKNSPFSFFFLLPFSSFALHQIEQQQRLIGVQGSHQRQLDLLVPSRGWDQLDLKEKENF